MSAATASLILIIDADRDARSNVARALELGGLRAIAAAGGALGLDLIAAQRPDLVLLDIRLADGELVYRRLRDTAGSRCVPIVVMGQLDDLAEFERAYRSGVVDFLIKSLAPPLLALRVRFLLRAAANAERARRRESALVGALGLTSNGYFVCGVDRGDMLFSARAHTILGLSAAEPLTSRSEFIARIEPRGRAVVSRALRGTAAPASTAAVEFEIRGADRKIRTIALRCMREDSARSPRIVGIVEDVTARDAAPVPVSDPADGARVVDLHPRATPARALEARIEETARRAGGGALLLIDLDRFQAINDRFGRELGDRLLQAVGRRLRDCTTSLTRRADAAELVAGRGGDQYWVLLPGVAAVSEIEPAARRIGDALREPYALDNRQIRVTASIGIAVHAGAAAPSPTALQRAELALALAKRTRRGAIAFDDAPLDARIRARLALQAHLRRAIDGHELSLHYQPQLSLATGELLGAEALLRWQHPSLGRISPAEFIPLAEDCGLDPSLGEWVLSETCRQLADWHHHGLRVSRGAVNLSANQFRASDLHLTVARILHETEFDPNRLQLELTARLLADDGAALHSRLLQLRRLGLRLAVDDVGTTGLAYRVLQTLPLDALKIDQSLIREIDDTGSDRTGAALIIAKAHEFGLRAIAEGIELEHQLGFLRSRHCDEGQGYLFSKPLPAPDFLIWAREYEREPIWATN